MNSFGVLSPNNASDRSSWRIVSLDFVRAEQVGLNPLETRSYRAVITLPLGYENRHLIIYREVIFVFLRFVQNT